MTAVPGDTPITIPLDEPTVAMETSELDHVPTAGTVRLTNRVESDTHTSATPSMGTGSGCTVNTADA
ncbi:hypothetical protein GCM10023093_07470 [Nemorincola caseinilytica]|uniref:Uncharacterized protein n=1 Tax=Nemorincola caseinilytica TaxID=2054315 RepID=A0ABP8N8R0_9BACT